MRKKDIIVSAIMLACTGLAIHAQSIVVTGGTVSPPKVTMRVYGFAADGTAETLQAADLACTVNGATVSVQADPEPASSGIRASVYMMVDASASSARGTPPTIDLAKAAATTANELLSGPGDEFGLAGADERPTMLFGLSADRTDVAVAIGELKPGKGYDLNNALFDPSMGGLVHLQSAASGRSLVLILDGSTDFDLTRAISAAETFKIKIYAIGLRTDLSSDVRKLCERSGGSWADGVTTEAEAVRFVRGFVSHAKALPATLVSYNLVDACTPEQTAVLARGASEDSFYYALTSDDISVLHWSSPGLDFSTSDQPSSKTVALTARGTSPITITSATSSKSAFTFSGITFPTTLQPGQSATITVQYAGGSSGVFATLQVVSDGCPVDALYMRAGSYTAGDVLKLTAPLGGESFVAGTTTNITWTGVLPSDLVRIDRSTDGGATWLPITETASGLSYAWNAGPEVTSAGRIRLQRTSLDSSAIVTMKGHLGPVYAVAFGRENRWIFTGGSDGTVRMWDAVSGQQIRQIGTHGDDVWCVGAHPFLSSMASGSHDGSVRIWDYETGARLGTFPADSRVWSLDYHPDGSSIVIGTEQYVTIISSTTYQQVRNVRADGRVSSVRFSADGSTVICAEGTTVNLRSAANLSTIVRSFPGHTSDVYAVDISPDGSKIVSGGADYVLRLFDASTGVVIAETEPAVATILDVDFAPDGSRLISAGGDGTAKVWTADNLSPLSSITGHSGHVYSARYDQSGSRIATSSTDATARVWTISGATLVTDRSPADYSIVSGTAETMSVNHGTVAVGRGADFSTNVITNIGLEPLAIRSVRVVSGDIDDFIVEDFSGARTLAPSESLTLQTSFMPKAAGVRVASMAIETGAGTLPVSLTGSGVPAALLMQGAKPLATSDIVDFGRLVAGQTFRDSTIGIVAGGTEPVVVTRITLQGTQSDPYTIVEGSGGFTVAPGQSRVVKLRFEPFTVGRFPARLVLNLEDGSAFVIRLYGEGSGDARISANQPSLLFPTDQCEQKSVRDSISVSNTGTSPLIVATAEIAGMNASEFRVVSPAEFPVTIAAEDSVQFVVEFDPQTSGSKDAMLVLTSNGAGSNNGRIEKQILARQDTVAFELSVKNMLFNNVNEGQTSTQTTSILNTGTVSLRWNTEPKDLGDFIITRIEPQITPPGGQTTITVLFKGGAVGQTYSAQHTFTDSVCGSSQTLNISATVKSYIGFTIAIDSVSAAIGTSIEVPVRMINFVNPERIAVSSVNVRMAVNGTILTPQFSTENMEFSPTGVRSFDVVLPIPQSSDLSASLRFETSWGNDTAGFIRIDSVWSSDTLVTPSRPGQVALSDLCREGGPRLYLRDLSSPLGLNANVIPHPVGDMATVDLKVIERGPTTAVLTDLAGREVLRLVEADLVPGRYQIPLRGSGLDPGTYVLTVTSRTQRMSQRITVVR